MNFQEHYYGKDAKEFVKLFEGYLTEYLDGESEPTSELDPQFISRLCDYLEKCFPSYGNFNTAISTELRNVMKGDNNQIQKMKKKIHDAINKAKAKFLDTVQNKCEKIQVVPKKPKEPKVPEPAGEEQPYGPNEL